jgi:uncharacterized protein YdhG (YjbR/CyaY superfamily)
MKTDPTAHRNIDEYIAGFPQDVQKILDKVRSTIKKASPEKWKTIVRQPMS